MMMHPLKPCRRGQPGLNGNDVFKGRFQAIDQPNTLLQTLARRQRSLVADHPRQAYCRFAAPVLGLLLNKEMREVVQGALGGTFAHVLGNLNGGQRLMFGLFGDLR